MKNFVTPHHVQKANKKDVQNPKIAIESLKDEDRCQTRSEPRDSFCDTFACCQMEAYSTMKILNRHCENSESRTQTAYEETPVARPRQLLRAKANLRKMEVEAREKFRKTLVITDNMSEAYSDLNHYNQCLKSIESKDIMDYSSSTKLLREASQPEKSTF